ncbi:hypothetical protein H310_12340 [Aphanomyces invadans]|uniref:Uncharacterized protein n=1 Tax=Aphanomyces invadans TaxID=157072 RepID=A0A024TJJ0_9STRA|nr:hypothetical protein H310_12340 [Aphanomyces invadans]ETV93776.1 hypothetical protein H310_12340 [Aphanomyces invadans]|eukprot:XP_008877585.1 hypothetical protein H310_12340 [Aphanomyces invadans]
MSALPQDVPPADETDDQYLAAQKHALLLVQDGQVAEADRFLQTRGYTHRLATAVLQYSFPGAPVAATTLAYTSDSPSIDPRPFVCAADNALPPAMLAFMQHALSSSHSPFWKAHQYSVDPPSPYFSYVHDLSQPRVSGLDDVVHYLKELAQARVPAVKRAKFAEWWTHCRPHDSGHQFHFDSADEGRGGVRNPIVSTVMFLEAPCGGPTVVTDQSFGMPKLGRHGWLVHPNENRFVVFNGKVLHGVVPGRPGGDHSKAANDATPPRRVTFMVAFWDFDVRQLPPPAGERPGSAMPLSWNADEAREPEWKRRFLPRCVVPDSRDDALIEVIPVTLPRVWERTNGLPLDNKMPAYDGCFQGF